MKKTVGALMIAVSAVAFAATSNADVTKMNFKPYVGADYSYALGNAKEIRPNYKLTGAANLGVNYNKYFGTEVYYQYSDTFTKHNWFGAKADSQFQSYGLDLMGYLPLDCNNKFNLVGTAGLGNYDFKNRVLGAGGSMTNRDNGYGWRYGAGVQYNFTNNFSARALYRYVDLHRISSFDNLQEFVVGARYTF